MFKIIEFLLDFQALARRRRPPAETPPTRGLVVVVTGAHAGVPLRLVVDRSLLEKLNL